MADPDNYTDPPTFLSHLQRNPRLQPYDFWPLVADSTVIVQHLSSVVIFICCFVGIYEDKVSPSYVSTLGNVCTVLGWGFWDYWVAHTQAARVIPKPTATPGSQFQTSENDRPDDQYADQQRSRPSSRDSELAGLGLNLNPRGLVVPSDSSHPQSMPSTQFTPSNPSSASSATSSQIYTTQNPASGHHPFTSPLSPRNQQRLATMKSAVLIYCALLGLSPILKSLTISTSSDSIWAISASLMCLNIFFFDYGGGVGAKFPASLSTNAALMSSTVLASRLPSAAHVFSLTLFSMEIFGLFPIFRRHLRHESWRGHLALAFALVLVAGGGLGLVWSTEGSWQAMLLGMLLWSLVAVLGMGGCSWWLIRLQHYKNVVTGPWDPARPVIRAGGWE
ncbi:MAG: hypothetical protein Q9228_001466 [Teloschistes exilis]